jgi:hypothetical protein
MTRGLLVDALGNELVLLFDPGMACGRGSAGGFPDRDHLPEFVNYLVVMVSLHDQEKPSAEVVSKRRFLAHRLIFVQCGGRE